MAENGWRKRINVGTNQDKYHTMFLSLIMLAVALSLSVIAAWYSIAGLAAIFAAAVLPIMIMGGILELAKVVVTLWLHEYWTRCRWLMKCYLVPAVFMLMVITSMGIFGFLSKAHSDQTLISGDVQSKIAIYDEKIKTSRDNIEANRRALKQLDEAVDQSMARSTSETGADKAVAIRKGQARERARLQAEIVAEQKTISKISEERAPIAAEIRKVEAEVGPIKYIAALIYGDNTDVNTLESAVRWVIIILVTVFDPLAIMMLLAATEGMKWSREKKQTDNDDVELLHKTVPAHITEVTVPAPTEPAHETESDNDSKPQFDNNNNWRMWPFPKRDVAHAYPPDNGPLTTEQIVQLQQSPEALNLPTLHKQVQSDLFADLDDDYGNCYKCNTALLNAPGIGSFCPNKECNVLDNVLDAEEPVVLVDAATTLEPVPEPTQTIVEQEQAAESVQDVDVVAVPEQESAQDIVDQEPAVDDDELNEMDPATKAAARRWKDANPSRTLKFQRKLYDTGQIDQLPWMSSDYYIQPVADNAEIRETQSGFGTAFPEDPVKGDTYVRIDRLPSVLYKFNGYNWIEVDKDQNNRYAYNEAYIDHLIAKIDSGVYDPELLSETERDQIEHRLTGN